MTLKDKARLSSRKSIVPSKCPFLLFMILRHSHDKAKFANKTLNSTLINSSQIFRRSQKILFFKWVCKFYFSQINANYILFKVSNSFWKRVQKIWTKVVGHFSSISSPKLVKWSPWQCWLNVHLSCNISSVYCFKNVMSMRKIMKDITKCLKIIKIVSLECSVFQYFSRMTKINSRSDFLARFKYLFNLKNETFGGIF